jgi:hypothetical protein
VALKARICDHLGLALTGAASLFLLCLATYVRPERVWRMCTSLAAPQQQTVPELCALMC